MARKAQTSDITDLIETMKGLVAELSGRMEAPGIGERVGHLVQIQHALRDLGAHVGASLTDGAAASGRARVLAYLRAQVGQIVHTDELLIVSGIGDYARRIRELRTEEGWPIISGAAVRDIRDDLQRRGASQAGAPGTMAIEEYVLIEDARDEDAPRRWDLAGELKGADRPPADLIREYLEASRGKRVSGEELRYVADNTAAWTHALSTLAGQGLAICGYNARAGDLPVGLYVLETK